MDVRQPNNESRTPTKTRAEQAKLQNVYLGSSTVAAAATSLTPNAFMHAPFISLSHSYSLCSGSRKRSFRNQKWVAESINQFKLDCVNS